MQCSVIYYYLDVLVSEVLNNSLHLVISEQIDGVSLGAQFLLEVRLEWLHDQSDFQVGVGSENLSGVHFLHLEAPVVKHDNLLSEIGNAHIGEFLSEFSQSFLSEVGGNEEITICDKEMGESFLDVALDGFLEVFADLAEVTTLIEHFSVELLESALVVFAHF